MKKRATITDVAAHAGVSRTTVSLVLADHPRITDETKGRVKESMRVLGYVYNRAAGGVRAGSSSLVGLVSPDAYNPFFAEFAMALDDVLSTSKRNVIAGYSRSLASREAVIVRSLLEQQVAGLVMVPTATSTLETLDLGSLATPLVQVFRRIDGLAADFVGVDNVGSGMLLGSHLADLGIDHVVVVSGNSDSKILEDRLSGLRTALTGPPSSGREDARVSAVSVDEFRQLIQAPDAPQSVVTYSDSYLLEVMHVLWESGLRPGEDVSVSSFDNTMLAKQLVPSITSVNHDASKLAETALDLLRRRIEQPDTAIQTRHISPELMVRRSSGFRRRG